jgi:hypothetical protein
MIFRQVPSSGWGIIFNFYKEGAKNETDIVLPLRVNLSPSFFVKGFCVTKPAAVRQKKGFFKAKQVLKKALKKRSVL